MNDKQVKSNDGYELARGVLQGKPEDIEAFKTLAKKSIWETCREQSGARSKREAQTAAEATFEEIWEAIAANGFSSLRSYAGRRTNPPSLRIFAILQTQVFMEVRVLRLLRDNPPQGWPFEALFRREIEREIALRFWGEDREICLRKYH
jgi:hypothetical protein